LKKQFGNESANPWLAVICQAGADSGVETARIVEWAERDGKRDSWRLHHLGLANYRAGRYEKAIDLFKESGTSAYNDFGLALAYHRLGRLAESRQSYERGLQGIKAGTPKDADAPTWVIPPHWIYAHVLQQEADRLLATGKSAPAGKVVPVK